MRCFFNVFLIVIVLFCLLSINIPHLNKLTFNNLYIRKIDNITISYINGSINKCLIIFASARSLNALISVFKSSTVNLTPAGVGMSLSVGKILDPVDDIIETLSNIVLFSIVSLGIQRFIIEIVPFVSVNIFLNLFFISCLLLLLIKKMQKKPFIHVTIKFFILAFIIRLILPSFVFINWIVDKNIFDKEYENAKKTLVTTDNNLTTNYGMIFNDTSGKSVIERLKNFFRKEDSSKTWIENLKDSAEDIVKSSVRLIIVFIIDLFLLPIFFLWFLYKLLKGTFLIQLFSKKLNL